MAGLVDTFCIQNLPQTSIEFLLKCVEEYQLIVTEEKKGDKAYLLKVVARHLTLETIENSADHGADIFLRLYKALGDELKQAGVKIEPTVNGTRGGQDRWTN